MSKENQINRKELVDMIAKKSSLSKKDSEIFIDAFVDVVGDTLVDNQKVNIYGFGAFLVRERAEKAVRNPRTGEIMKTPAMKMPVFKAGILLKNKVNRIE